jgi:hypothetical protein
MSLVTFDHSDMIVGIGKAESGPERRKAMRFGGLIVEMPTRGPSAAGTKIDPNLD